MTCNRYMAILIAIVVAAGYLALKPPTAEGVVDHKAITGTRDSTSHTIATITDTGTHVEDPEFAEDLNASTTVDDALAHRLDSWYDEIRYVISVRTDEETMAYVVSMEDFNEADIGDTILFEKSRSETPAIKIIRVIS